MGCEYSYYNTEETYYSRLYCKINNRYCPYSKRCTKLEKYIPIEEDIWKECRFYMNEKIKNIPQGSYFVKTFRKNDKGNKTYLYVLIEDKIEKITTGFSNFNQNYIYLKKGIDGFEVSLTPFTKEKKQTKKSEVKNEEE